MPNPNQNLHLWENLRPVDRKFTKPITGKSYKGDSPNPTYIIMKLTEVLGPIGDKWGFTVKFDRVRQGKPHQVIEEQHTEYFQPTGAKDANGNLLPPPPSMKRVKYQIIREEIHEVCVTFWFDRDGQTRTFDAYGGTPMLYMSKSGNWIHDEDAAKKSLTDAYTKGASFLGACADIFLGLFDDKYTSQPYGGDAQPPANDGTAPPPHSGHQPPQDGHQPPPQGNRPSGQRNTTSPF